METTNFIDTLISDIKDSLNEYKGTNIYMCDLACKLFEAENTNGTVLFSTYQTKEFIKEHFDLFGDLVEYCSDNMDMTLNPFSEPEKAHVILLLESAQSVLSQCKTVDKYWNDSKELTPSLIKKISKELDELNLDDEDIFN